MYLLPSAPRRLLEISGDVHFSGVAIGGRVFDSDMNGFSIDLFANLACYLELGDAGSRMVV